MLREFGPIKRRRYSEPKVNGEAAKNPQRKKKLTPQRQMLIVDGYNVIHAWESLREIAAFSLERAREALMDLLSNYVAFTKTELLLVFDAYLVKDGQGSDFMHDGYRVVYTKENETADAFIERTMHELGPDYGIRMVSGDWLLQISALQSGVLRMTAAEFEDEVTRTGNEIRDFLQKLVKNQK
jgi:predicted RNA-binding protein with PIN domain